MKKHLLLVGSDTRSLELLAAGLRQEGYGVTRAADGREAWAKLETLSPDLLIADAVLPEVDGLELLSRLRQRPISQQPLIFIFANDDSEAHRRRAIELSADEILCKPLLLRELVQRVAAGFARRLKAQITGVETLTKSKIEGRFDELSLLDLLDAVESGARSGLLTLRGREEILLSLERGRIVDASSGQLHGEEAICRAFSFRSGTFVLDCSVRSSGSEPLNFSVSEQGVSWAGEWERLLSAQSLDAVYEVHTAQLSECLPALPDEINALLQLFNGRRSLLDVLDQSPFDDFSTLAAVARLQELEVLLLRRLRAPESALARTLSPSPHTSRRPSLSPLPVVLSSSEGAASVPAAGSPAPGAALEDPASVSAVNREPEPTLGAASGGERESSERPNTEPRAAVSPSVAPTERLLARAESRLEEPDAVLASEALAQSTTSLDERSMSATTIVPRLTVDVGSSAEHHCAHTPVSPPGATNLSGKTLIGLSTESNGAARSGADGLVQERSLSPHGLAAEPITGEPGPALSLIAGEGSVLGSTPSAFVTASGKHLIRASEESEEIGERFFQAGEEGTYRGGPSSPDLLQHDEHDEHDEHDAHTGRRSAALRTPQQERRRAHSIRLVVAVMGVGLAFSLVALFRYKKEPASAGQPELVPELVKAVAPAFTATEALLPASPGAAAQPASAPGALSSTSARALPSPENQPNPLAPVSNGSPPSTVPSALTAPSAAPKRAEEAAPATKAAVLVPTKEAPPSVAAKSGQGPAPAEKPAVPAATAGASRSRPQLRNTPPQPSAAPPYEPVAPKPVATGRPPTAAFPLN